MEKLTVDVKQLCELINISRSNAYQLVNQGVIPSIRLGRRIIIPVVALNRLLDIDPRRNDESSINPNRRSQ
jgi:excisionase family DNA binding protein